MEASSHAIDQSRVADVDFNYTVFTNLSPEHLDYHGTMANYFQAKLTDPAPKCTTLTTLCNETKIWNQNEIEIWGNEWVSAYYLDLR